jgi:NAD(P)-dependent dehydrogenase (short-subunit alcohol dehydrogenase family)
MASDSGIDAGALQPKGLDKLLRAQELTLENKLPYVQLVESAGANLMTYRVEDFVRGEIKRKLNDPLGDFDNLGATRRKGVDVQLSAQPVNGLSFWGAVAWQKAIEQNLMSVIRLCRGALPSMREQGWGRIVNITALSAIQPIARFGLSVATWAGVLGYAKTLSLELANQGITINTICPGRIATGRLATVFGNGTPGQLEQEQMAQITKLIPMGRVGEPNEIAGLVAFLCSPWGAYMTGTVQHVDGGRLGSLL